MNEIKTVPGGVCATKGFLAGGIHCGIRKNKTKKDLAVILSSTRAVAAAVYTTNLVKGAPLTVTKEHLSDGYAQAVIVNSGNANTCNDDGYEKAQKMCALLSEKINIKTEDVVVASTGVIGEKLDITPIENSIGMLTENLSADSEAACEAIMTTDTVKKSAAVSFELNGKTVTVGGIAKGSGMIHPDMATMLVFLTSDIAITGEMLQKALSSDVAKTFNMLSVDGDTSTNDMVVFLANGLAGNNVIDCENDDFALFMKAVNTVTTSLCRLISGDGEGATKNIECRVSGAADEENAKKIAKSVICSSLVKTAMFGSDANWGRVLCAIGYAKADVDISKISVNFSSEAGSIKVCENGCGIVFSETEAKKVLSCEDIDIIIELGDGNGKATAWGCDLTYDYVKINGDYRT